VREPKKPWNHLDVSVKPNSLRHHVLRPTVEQYNNEDDKKVNGARGVFGHP
jgi:hypothetical protein